MIAPLCDLLSIPDTKVVEVALTGLGNILKLGHQDSGLNGTPNPYALKVEECGGLDKIEFLQGHQNEKIYKKTFQIIETYFSQEEEDTGLMPQVSGIFYTDNINWTSKNSNFIHKNNYVCAKMNELTLL